MYTFLFRICLDTRLERENISENDFMNDSVET